MAYKSETIPFEMDGKKESPIVVRYGDSPAEGKFVFARYMDNPDYIGRDLEFWQKCADTALTIWLGKNGFSAKGPMLTEGTFPPNRMAEYA